MGLGFKSMRYAFLTSVVLVVWGLGRRRAAQDTAEDTAVESPVESGDSVASAK